MVRHSLLILLGLAFALLPCRVRADGPLGPGEFGLFGDAAGLQQEIDVVPFQTFEFYVLANAPVGGIRAWEMSLQSPAYATIVEVQLDDPLTVNVGWNTNLIVGLHDGCLFPDTYRLATVQAILLDQDPIPGGQICPGPASPSSFDPPAAGYLDCVRDLVPMPLSSAGAYTDPGCVFVGDSTCGPLQPARTIVWLDDGGGPTGSTVGVPVTAMSGAHLDCGAIPRPITSLTFDLRWELPEVSLLGAEPGDLPPDWSVSLTPLADGAQVEFSGTTPIELPFAPHPMGSLRFRLADVPTETELLLHDPSVSSGHEAVGNVNNPSSLVSGSVSVETDSFGALKARFGR